MLPKQESNASRGMPKGRSTKGRQSEGTKADMGEHFRMLVEQVPAIIYTDSATEILKTLYISPQLKILTGYDPKEYVEDDELWVRMIFPEDRERVLAEYTRAFKSEQPVKYEYRVLTSDGNVLWFSDETRLIRNKKGKPLFWQGVMVDITARKRAEQVQHAIYRFSHAVVTTPSLDELFKSIHTILGELMPVKNLFIALYDPKRDLISFPYYIDQYDTAPPPGKPEHGLTEYVLWTKEPLWATEAVFSELVSQGKVDVIGTDSVDWIGVPLFVGDRVTGVMVTQSYTEGVYFSQEHFDLMKFISTQVALAIEHKLDLQRIADGLEYNKTLINSSSLGIRTYDASGHCILANESISRILGIPQEQILSENYHTLDPWKESGLLDSAQEAVSSGTETRREIQTTNAAGDELWLDCRFTPFTSNGEPHLLVSVDDITISKQAEVNLQIYAARLEQSNRDLQEFAYIASHDLQEPLRKVLAFGDRLSNKYGNLLDDTGRDYLKRMQEASQRMQTLINDLLTFSRVSTRALPFAKLDLNSIAQDVVSDLEHQIEIVQGQVELGKLPEIEADPTQMHQLLQNVITNGLKFHREFVPPIIKVSCRVKGNRCILSIIDNGIGFDMQYLDRIFKPFQRLHSRQEFEGSGMGLAICRRIVERHGGEITASSVEGEGSTFLITIPIRHTKWENSHA